MNRPDPLTDRTLSAFDFECKLQGRDPDRERAIARARLEQRNSTSPVGQDTRPEALAEVTRSPLDPARGIVIGVGLTLLVALGIVAGVVIYRWIYPWG